MSIIELVHEEWNFFMHSHNPLSSYLQISPAFWIMYLRLQENLILCIGVAIVLHTCAENNYFFLHVVMEG